MTRTFKELQDDLTSRMSASSTSAFWTPANKKSWINQGLKMACRYGDWDFLESAKCTTTKQDQDYFDLPPTFRLGGIKRITVGGTQYNYLLWEDFLNYTGTDYVYSIFGKQYFFKIAPDPGQEIVIWGLIDPPKLVNDDDESIFPNDEVIVKLALSICLNKEKRHNEATKQMSEAFAMCDQLAEQISSKAKVPHKAMSSRWL